MASTLTIMELTVKPMQFGRVDVAAEYERILENLPNLALIDLSRDAIRRAAELRAAHHIPALDALQIATCLIEGATAFVTNDLRLRRVTNIHMIILDDFVEPPSRNTQP